MCLELYKGYQEKVADKDIICYKLGYLHDKKFSPFIKTFFKYKPNILVESRMDIFKPNGLIAERYKIKAIVEAGLHSFKNRRPVMKTYKISTQYEENANGFVIGIFIIPKYSNYYTGIYRDYDDGKFQSYASNKIIWTGKYFRKIGGKISLLND